MKEAIKKFMPQNFNDFLCLFVMAFIFILWIIDANKAISLNPEVLGATIAFFTIIGQFYYRRKSGGD
jgi:hypothetical protein